MSDEKKKCAAIEHPNLASGWGCCNCNTYNSNYFAACKYCEHKRCDKILKQILN